MTPGQRSQLVWATLGALVATVAVITMISGQYELSPTQVVDALTGGGSSADRLVVIDFRLPRTIAAALVGVALGLAGAIFQSLSRNPLGSPDIVGFTTGSATGALSAIVIGGGSAASLLLSSVVGGLVTTAIVVLFATRQGLPGRRLILVGIAIGACLGAVNDYLITRAELDVAQRAKVWLFGSLNLTTWTSVAIIGATLILAVPLLALAARRLHMLELGDDTAAALGVPTTTARLTLMALGVLLTAAAIATAGPIGFVALAAPQLAKRALRSSGMPLAGAALLGAALLISADLLAQRLLTPFQIPVGLVTAALGGAYLLWLIITERSERRPV